MNYTYIESLLKMSSISGISKPDIKGIDSFLNFITEANDIVRNVALSIVHKKFLIEKTDGTAVNKNDKNYKKLFKFVDDFDNDKAHIELLMSYFSYGFAAMEVAGTKMYSINAEDAELIIDKDKYTKKGIVEVIGIKRPVDGVFDTREIAIERNNGWY